MRLNRKIARLGICAALLVVFGAGCGGITASKSISPLDFFLPGLLRADPPPAETEPHGLPTDHHVTELAQN